jgi:hypothetical protein
MYMDIIYNKLVTMNVVTFHMYESTVCACYIIIAHC